MAFKGTSEVSSDQCIREDVNAQRNKKDIACERRCMMLKEVHLSLEEWISSTRNQVGREQSWNSNACQPTWLLEELRRFTEEGLPNQAGGRDRANRR